MAYVINEDCIACGTCIDECPVNAISEGDIYKIDPDACTDCGTCADACPTGSNSSCLIRIIRITKYKGSFLASFFVFMPVIMKSLSPFCFLLNALLDYKSDLFGN